MIGEHIKLALNTIAHAKLRSVLTMLGIIIGVSSVTTVVAIGQGVRNQVADEVNQFGANLVQVTPGQAFIKNEEGEVESFNFAAGFGASNLSEQDLETVLETEGVESAAPIMIISGNVSFNSEAVSEAFIVATTEQYPVALNQEINAGNFFTSSQTGNVAVIGGGLAKNLFGSNPAIGGVVEIRGERFTVIGVMEEVETTLDFGGANLNNALYIPLEAGKEFNQGVVQIIEIDAQVSEEADIDEVVARLEANLRENHGGEEDFSVVKQSELVKVADTILNLITSFVAAIAAISLVVGGIGIMNIMLVSVTERTREIGLRKAIGATKRQILLQFLIEAVVLSVVGGILGVGLAYAIVALVSLTTGLTGAFSLSIILIATGVSGLVGVIFGIMPAAKAANKDPIIALRYE